MNRKIIKVRIFFWLVLFFVVGWFLYMGIVPNGKISYKTNFKKQSEFIGKLTPQERIVIDDNIFPQKIVGDPVYFSLRTPRQFNKAKLIFKYKSSNLKTPVIEAGVLVDNTVWRYNLKPIENKIIDQLSLVWDVIQENNIILLQREKKYNSIEEFINNLPNREEIALYNYLLRKEYLIDNYERDAKTRSLDFNFRDAYQFYTYIKNEDLNFSFEFLDLNKNKDSDSVDINLYYNDSLISSRHLDDDGILVDSGEVKDARIIELKEANLLEGVYKVEVRCNNDIITKQITTSQKKLAFINKIWVVDGKNDDFIIFTDSREISAQTINPGSLQIINIDGENLEINSTYKQFSKIFKSSAEAIEIKIKKDDIILSGNGVFSFSEEELINPSFKKVSSNIDINKEGINYVLADYLFPEQDGDWKIAEIEFDLTGVYREFNKYSFLISVSDLHIDDDINDWIEIDEIKFELEGTNLAKKIKSIFN